MQPMSEQADLLWRIVTTFDGLDPQGDRRFAITFMLLTVCVGVATVVLDLCYFLVTGASFLRLNHGWASSPVLVLAWPLGSAIFAWFGLAIDVLQPTLLGSVAAASAWTLAIERTISKLSERLDRQIEEAG
jgi:hypothetical protein